jgi:hypothetical protein
VQYAAACSCQHISNRPSGVVVQFVCLAMCREVWLA